MRRHLLLHSSSSGSSLTTSRRRLVVPCLDYQSVAPARTTTTSLKGRRQQSPSRWQSSMVATALPTMKHVKDTRISSGNISTGVFHRTQARLFFCRLHSTVASASDASRRNHGQIKTSTVVVKNSSTNEKPWHHPSFMLTSTPTEKEMWLESLLEQEKARMMHNQKQQPTTPNVAAIGTESNKAASEVKLRSSLTDTATSISFKSLLKATESASPQIDVEAFLVVLRSLTGWSLSSPAEEKSLSSGTSNPRRAEYWIQRMIQAGLRPTPACYQCVIQAWANSGVGEQPLVIVNRSERWLHEMTDPLSLIDKNQNENELSDPSLSTSIKYMPTIECYDAFLDACTRGRQGKNKRSQQILLQNSLTAESLLRRLVSLSFHHNKLPKSLHPTTTTFNHVIRGISRCKDDETISDRILALVRMMEGFQNQHCRRQLAASSHENIKTGDGSSNSHFDPPCPNTKTYSMAMDSLISVAKMKARRHYNRRQRLLDSRFDYEGGHYDEHDYYNTPYAQDTYSDYGESFETSSESSHPRDDNGLKEMEEATAILQYMHDLYDAGVPGIVPHRVPYNILITGWAALASYGVGRSAGNDVHSDQEDVSWYCDSAPLKAEEILRTMMSHGDGQEPSFRNSSMSFFGDILAGDSSGGTSKDKFVKLGSRNKKCPSATPDRISYEKVILAWANSGHPNAGKRALWWLKQLWSETELAEMDAAKSGSRTGSSSDARVDELHPTTTTYNVVMKALGSSPESGGALEAENLLLDLGEKYRFSSSENKNYQKLRPNSESFAIVIRAWLQEVHITHGADNRVECLKRAVEWLSSLREVENENDLSTAPELFIGVLQAAKRCARDRPDVIGLATETFETFRDSRYQVDGACYSTMLQVGLQAYSGIRRENELGEFVHKLVEDCCDDGLVSNTFVRTIANHNSYECRDVTQKYFQNWPLPTSWSRNVKNRNTIPSPGDLRPHNNRPKIQRTRKNHRQ